MEILIILLIIIVLLLIVGVSTELILFGLMVLMLLMMAVLFVFFSISAVRLILCERTTGKVSKITVNERFGFRIPNYKIGDGEFPNVFPCEMVMKKQLYAEGRECRLFLDKKRKRVYDGNARASIIAGVFLSAASIVLLILRMNELFGNVNFTIMR